LKIHLGGRENIRAQREEEALDGRCSKDFFNGSQKENRMDTEVKVPFRKEDIERAK
jgi:hypothetical protein